MKMFKMGSVVLAAALLACGPRPAYAATKPLGIQFGGGHLLELPFQNMNGTELYSVREGKGYPALESVLYQSPRRRTQVSIGAAAELGASKAVPFVGAQLRLPEKFFDTSNNDLFFGVAAAKHFGPETRFKSWRGVELTLKASKPLW